MRQVYVWWAWRPCKKYTLLRAIPWHVKTTTLTSPYITPVVYLWASLVVRFYVSLVASSSSSSSQLFVTMLETGNILQKLASEILPDILCKSPDIRSDILSGTTSEILSDIPHSLLAYPLTFCLTPFLASLLTLFPTYRLEFCLTFFAYLLASFWHIFRHSD